MKNERFDNDDNQDDIEEDNSKSKRRESSSTYSGYSKFLVWLDKNRVSFIWTAATFLTGILFLIITVLTFNLVNKNSQKISELKAKNLALTSQINDYNDKIVVENDKYFAKMLMRLFPEDKLQNMAKDYWLYSISVNGAPVKGNTVNVNTANVVVSLTQTEKVNKLPSLVSIKGSVTNGDPNKKFNDLASVTATTTKPTQETKQNAESKSITQNYQFTNLNVGEIVTINLDPELATRLGLTDNIVEIFFASKEK